MCWRAAREEGAEGNGTRQERKKTVSRANTTHHTRAAQERRTHPCAGDVMVDECEGDPKLYGMTHHRRRRDQLDKRGHVPAGEADASDAVQAAGQQNAAGAIQNRRQSNRGKAACGDGEERKKKKKKKGTPPRSEGARRGERKKIMLVSKSQARRREICPSSFHNSTKDESSHLPPSRTMKYFSST